MVKMSEHEEFISAEMVKNGDLLEIMNAGRFLTADETPFKRAAAKPTAGSCMFQEA